MAACSTTYPCMRLPSIAEYAWAPAGSGHCKKASAGWLSGPDLRSCACAAAGPCASPVQPTTVSTDDAIAAADRLRKRMVFIAFLPRCTEVDGPKRCRRLDIRPRQLDVKGQYNVRRGGGKSRLRRQDAQ